MLNVRYLEKLRVIALSSVHICGGHGETVTM